MNTAENIIPIRGNQQMNNLPEPLTPAYSDIRDFGDLPIDVTRVQDSKFAAVVDPASGYYAMMLWFASWHRVPAASLPNDDRQLCHLAGMGRDLTTWKQVKEGALYGWTECSDGNLYHPVLSEKALVAWIEKVHQRIRSGRGNAARWGCEFSEEADLVAKFHEAWEMLKKANPASKLILKGNPLENSKDSARNPTGNPTGNREGIPTQSQGKVREGKVREGIYIQPEPEPAEQPQTEEPQPLASDVCIPENDKKSSIAKKASKKASMPSDFAISTNVREWANKSGYGLLEARLEHFRNWATAKGATYADWDAAFRNAIAGDWANLNGRNQPVNGRAATDNNPPPPRYLN